MALCAWDTRQHFGIALGGHFQQGSHQLKAVKCKKTHHKTDCRKDPRLEPETRSRVPPGWTSAGKMGIGGIKFFAALYMPTNDIKNTGAIDLRVAKIF